MFLTFAAELSQVHAQNPAASVNSPDSVKEPAAHVQILNGISPDEVSLSINGQLLNPGMGPGARITSFGVMEKELKVSLARPATGEQKDIVLKIPKRGYYTLVLTGDFSPLPPITLPGGAKKNDYRVTALLLPNGKPKGDKVDLRLVNGTNDRTIKILRKGAEQCQAGPGQQAVAASQPAELHLQAVAGETKMDLYLAQEPPASNITVVFYNSGDRLAFRAMTETWAETPPAP